MNNIITSLIEHFISYDYKTFIASLFVKVLIDICKSNSKKIRSMTLNK